eukprot:364285-Chlamydomonas_euryale.AAC.7
MQAGALARHVGVPMSPCSVGASAVAQASERRRLQLQLRTVFARSTSGKVCSLEAPKRSGALQLWKGHGALHSMCVPPWQAHV